MSTPLRNAGIAMKLEIRGRRVEITAMLRRYIERRLGFALDRFGDRIRIVQLRLESGTASRNAVDTRCRIAVSMLRSSTVNLGSRASTLEEAVDRIADKLGMILARQFGRRRDYRSLRRHASQLFGSAPLQLPGDSDL